MEASEMEDDIFEVEDILDSCLSEVISLWINPQFLTQHCAQVSLRVYIKVSQVCHIIFEWSVDQHVNISVNFS